MIDQTRIIKFGLAGALLATLGSASAAVSSVCAQTTDSQKKTVTTRRVSEGRDPFRKFEPPRVIAKKTGQILPPSIDARIAQYKAQKVAAMNARMPAPKPTTALLLNEIQVVGITRTPRGYAAIVEATPIKLSYVMYPGERLYDGLLVAIEENRLVFRRETVFADGRREHSVELKALRQPSAIQAMTSLKSAPTATAMAEPEKPKAASTTEKP